MQWVSVLSLLSAVTVIFARDTNFNNAIEKYADHCTEKYTTPGYMTIAYLVGNKNVYGRIDAFDVETFSTVQAEDTTAASRLLVQTACLCTEIELNSYEFIVVPLMIDGAIGDALTVCVFHEVKDEQEVTEILRMPGIGFLRNWMTAQYYVHMIRTLNAPAADVTDCIGKDGHPVNNIIGQRTCYYVNLAKFEEGVAAIDVDQKLYYGPFLGSMIPDMMELAKAVDTDLDYLDFVTRFDYVKCSLLKNHSRLDSTILKTGCRFEAFRDKSNTIRLAAVFCCCVGKDDPNCKEVTAAVKEQKILCVGGTDRNPTFFFAQSCSHKVVKKYERIGATKNEDMATLEHSKALLHQRTAAIFEKDTTCEPLKTVTCRSGFVYNTDQGCCSGPHFCNLHRFLNLAFKRCAWSFGEKQEIDGCMVIFYRAEDKWYKSSSLWFEMDQTELIHLYSVAGNEISRALVVEKNVDPTCSEHTERYVRDYYVVSCYGSRNCDEDFTQKGFFKSLDEKVITDAMQKDDLPRCETGNVTFATTDSARTMPSVSPNTTRVIGLHCVVRLTATDENNSRAISVTFEPVFPKPENCTRQVAKLDSSTYTCCYPANSNASFIDEHCHYSTIVEKAFPPQAEVTTTDATTESTDLIPRQSVHEYADYCEQNNMDDFGVPSLQCQPGGIGCFHLLEMDEARDEVIASCIGHAEEKVAASQQFFDQYHEALLCQAEELKNKCQYVILKSGVMPKLLCCCSVSVVRNNVAYCVEDTNTMFNEYKFELKTIGEYRDVKEDDEDDEAGTDDE